MECGCGFNFSRARLSGDSFQSFAVIDDQHYREFLTREQAVRRARKQEDRMKALAKSADLVGSLLLCPQCGLYTLLTPGGIEKLQLQRTASS